MARLLNDTGTLDAAEEASATIVSNKVDIHVLNAGDFSGTIEVQQAMEGAWVIVDSIIAADMPFHKVFEPADVRSMRLYCSARADGAATYYLAGA